ncbi:MAG TPA: DUF721 domain-containing protein [Verrucomicrobiae bacterium]|nr:DUF721 domain-containing protein [Verrucomicrobiae bacterium]
MTLRKLGASLEGWAPERRAPGDPLMAIAAAWPEIVGKEVAANSHPTLVERGVLVVTARSGAWSQQLTFLSEQILDGVRARFPAIVLERLRLRVGKLPAGTGPRARPVPGSDAAGTRTRPKARDADEAVARFRADVEAYQRAKRAAGWKECQRCGALIAPRMQAFCVVCANARGDHRAGTVARLLFEAPWLGYEGIAPLIEGLQRDEYERIRKSLLARWWETLARAGRSGRLSRDGRERLIASSYVLLKSGVSPERLVPATVRNLLGDVIHDVIYGMEPNTRNVQ